MLPADAKRLEERIKLLATALSNVGVAAIVTGFVSPLFGGRFHPDGALDALLLGMVLHFVAQLLLHYVVGTSKPLPPSEAGTSETGP